MNKPLPYPIPGPAGGAIARVGMHPSAGTGKDDVDVFACGAWRSMQNALGLSPADGHQLLTSLAVVRHLALFQSSDRVSQLPVLISSLRWVGGDAAVTLRDPTATLCATVHATVFTSFRDTPVRIGSVLLLQDVSACTYALLPRGFRVDASQSIHLNVRRANVSRVFTQPQYDSSFTTPSHHPADVYTPYARAPPLPVRPISIALSSSRPHVSPISTPSHRTHLQTSAPRPLRSHNRPPLAADLGPRKRPSSQPPIGGPSKRPALPSRSMSVGLTRPPVGAVNMNPLLSSPAKTFSSGVSTAFSQCQNVSSPLGQASVPAMVALSDEHLDSLLSDFDVDAVIETHTKSQGHTHSKPGLPPKTNAPAFSIPPETSSTVPPPPSPSSSKIDLTGESEARDKQVTQLSINSQVPDLSRHQFKSSINESSLPRKSPLVPPTDSSAQHTGPQCRSTKLSSTTNISKDTSVLSAVNDDMIRGLLEGLNADDFASEEQ